MIYKILWQTSLEHILLICQRLVICTFTYELCYLILRPFKCRCHRKQHQNRCYKKREFFENIEIASHNRNWVHPNLFDLLIFPELCSQMMTLHTSVPQTMICKEIFIFVINQTTVQLWQIHLLGTTVKLWDKKLTFQLIICILNH